MNKVSREDEIEEARSIARLMKKEIEGHYLKHGVTLDVNAYWHKPGAQAPELKVIVRAEYAIEI